MYTRSYNDADPCRLPEGYGGTLLDEGGAVCEEDRQETETAATAAATVPIFGWLSGIGSGLSGLFGTRGGLKLGTEELLLIGVALFLLFSKDGDKECAIIFLLALFITK